MIYLLLALLFILAPTGCSTLTGMGAGLWVLEWER